MCQKLLRQVFKLKLTKYRSRPIKSRVDPPIRERVQSISLKTNLSFFVKYFQSTLVRPKQLMPFQSMNIQKNWPHPYRNSHIQSLWKFSTD